MQRNITDMNKNVETTAYRKDLKLRIMSTAMAMFREKGIKSVKMDDIAASLSISKRTLYEIFDNKELLLYEALRTEHESNSDAIRISCEKQDTNVMDTLLAFYHHQMEEFSRVCPAFFTELGRYPKVLQYLHAEDQRNKENAMRFFMRGIDEGFFRSDINYDIVTRVNKMGINEAMESRMFDEYSLPEIFSNIILTFFRGICTPKGMKMLEHFSLSNDFVKH